MKSTTTKEISAVLKKLKEEHNKTAQWIEFFTTRMDVMERKLERIEKIIQKLEEQQLLLAKGVLNVHEKLEPLQKKR